MHIAMVIDEDRLKREHVLLNRLSIGLVSEGARLTRIVPDQYSGDGGEGGQHEHRAAMVTHLEAPMRVLPWMRRDRVQRLLEPLEKEPIDVLYALGTAAWSLAIDLARAAERPLALEVWSADTAKAAPRGRAAKAVSAYLAPTAPLAALLRERVTPGLVCHVPMGVAVPAEPRPVFNDPENGIALAIIGSGRDLPAYRGLLSGLSRVVRTMPQVQAFLELRGPGQHDVWRHANREALLANLSSITDAAQHRTLLTRCDVLIVPERLGEMRSIILEAMAFGMPVIASRDPHLDVLDADQTATVVDDPESADAWAEALEQILAHPEDARAQGLRGREHVASHCRSSLQVEQLLEQMDRIAHEGAYGFDVPDAS